MPGVGLIRSKLRPSRWLSPKNKQSFTKRQLLITASSKSFSARCANSVSKSSSDRHRESANAPAANIPKVPYLSAIPLRAFATALVEHGGDPTQIEAIAMDMSPAYVKGATEYFPRARIVFDKFHVMVLAGRALDQVRCELQREGADLKGAMWSLRGNTWNLSEDRQKQRKNLCRQYTATIFPTPISIAMLRWLNGCSGRCLVISKSFRRDLPQDVVAKDWHGVFAASFMWWTP